MCSFRAILAFALVSLTAVAQQAMKPKDVREIAREGSVAIPKLRGLLKNPDTDVRLEAVKQIIEIGTARSLDPLIEAAADNDPEIQIRATDGMVNFYLPGYYRTGLSASLRRVGTGIKGRFTDINDQIVDPYITVRPDVIAALGKLARGGSRMEVRANAARSVGILRGRAAVPDLIEALKSKDSDVIYEALVALQKIRDESAATRITFLLRDLDPKVQVSAVETVGLLQNKAALPDLVDVLNRTRDKKVQRAALTAIAMLPDEKSRDLFARYINDKDDRLRGAAAEGFGRLKNPADLKMLDQAWQEERKTSPKLSVAFALVMLGHGELTDFSPLQYLVNTLNTSSYRGEARPLLIELARNPVLRASLYRPLLTGSKDEKINLAQVMAVSGDKDTIAQLDKLSRDADTEVAQEGLRAMRSLQARL